MSRQQPTPVDMKLFDALRQAELMALKHPEGRGVVNVLRTRAKGASDPNAFVYTALPADRMAPVLDMQNAELVAQVRRVASPEPIHGLREAVRYVMKNLPGSIDPAPLAVVERYPTRNRGGDGGVFAYQIMTTEGRNIATYIPDLVSSNQRHITMHTGFDGRGRAWGLGQSYSTVDISRYWESNAKRELPGEPRFDKNPDASALYDQDYLESRAGRAFTHETLMRISETVAKLEENWHAAWVNLTGPEGSRTQARDVIEACRTLNQQIEPLVDMVADVTGNSRQTLRQVFAPQDEYSVWFGNRTHYSPSAFIRNVATYGSFRPSYWESEAARRQNQLYTGQPVTPAPEEPSAEYRVERQRG